MEPAEPWWQNDPTLRELRSRELEELERGTDELDPPTLGEPDPVVDELYSGTCLRALAAVRDDLARARAEYDTAVRQARVAGLSWGEMGAVLGVPKQQLHRRFRHG